MSRIGKVPIKIKPEYLSNTEVEFRSIGALGSEVTIKGKFGVLQQIVPKVINVTKDADTIIVSLNEGSKKEKRVNKALHGLYRTLINNMIIGVTEQFLISLELVGVGYKANVQGKSLILNLGFSHPVDITIPEQLTIEIEQNTTINIRGCDKQKVGVFAAELRSWRPPEPYKGKGIRFKGEVVRRLAGKSGKK